VTLWLCLVLVMGCHAPISANRTSMREARKDIAVSALDGRLSDPTKLVLHRFDLED